MKISAIPFACISALAACSPPQSDETPTEVGGPDVDYQNAPVSPPLGQSGSNSSDEDDATILSGPLAEGRWFFNDRIVEDYGPRAIFGRAGTDGRFSVACSGFAGQIVISRAGTLGPIAEIPMRVVLDSGSEELTAQSSIGELPTIEVRLAPDNPFLDDLAAARGRIAVVMGDDEPLRMPAAGSEIRQVVEACRN